MAGIVVEFVVAVLATVLLSAWAHAAQTRQALRNALVVVLLVIAVPLLGFGAFLLARHGWSDARGWLPVALGLGIMLPLLGPFRRLLSLITPMDRHSVPDMLGLVILAVVAIASAYSSLTSGPHLETTASPSTFEIIAQSLTEVLIAFFAVGWLISQGGRATICRLGLRWPTQREVVYSLLLVLAGFAISAAAGYLTQLLQPGVSQQIQDEMKQITGNVSSGWGAVILGTSAGVGEEILFRGAIQPRFGIVLTSIVFALLHIQYGISLTVLGIFGLSVLLGWERQRYGTSSAIVTHGVYDGLVVLLSGL